MSRRIFEVALVLTLVGLVGAWGVAPVSAQMRDQTVTITTGPVADKPVIVLNIDEGASETVTFLNNTGEQINVNNTATPPGGTDKDGGSGNDVLNGNFVDYVFSCLDDAGEGWVFTVTQGENSINVVVNVRCRQVPTLTGWGILILALLIGGTGIWILTRKRLAARQA